MTMKTKRISSGILMAVILFAFSVFKLPGAYLLNVPVTVVQPDGRVLELFASGDEYYNWLHDRKGFTIMQDPSNGYYVYAIKADGALVPSTLLPGAGVDPELNGFERHVLADPARRPAPEDVFPLAGEIVNAPHVGTLNNLVIFIRFSDEAEFTDNISSYNSLFNTTTAGANSMRNYFYEVSYNTLTIPSTFYPTPGATVISYKDSQPRNYFRPYDASTNPIGYTTDRTAREHNLLKRAVDYVNGLGQFPSGASIDSDNDGYVDNVCFVIYGTPGAWSSLLWPHRWSLYSVTAMINGKRVYDFNFQLQSTTLSWGVGVLAHEMFHSLGSPDLYHYTGNGITPVGGWDLMENNANPPQHMLTHMKWKYGKWLATVPQITVSGTYTLNPTTSATSNCYKIASPNSATQYFMVEYRKKTSTFENSIPNEGLIVYRIDTAAVGNASGPPDEVYIYRPNGTPTVNGTVSQANFSSNSGRTAINDSTNPSSFLANGSVGGLDISNVTAIGSTISFTVGFTGDYAIGGTVTAGGSALAGVVLNGLPGNPVTNGSGIYAASVSPGWSGTVIPTLAGYSFTPVQTVYSTIYSNQTTNYTAVALPPVQVTLPNGGEIWQQGTVHPITWTSYALTNVKIEYSTNNGAAWTTIIASTPAAGGSYSWSVPSTPSASCLVRISDAANAATNDVSNSVFTISLTAPSYYNSPASRLLFPEVNWVGANNGGMWVTEMQIIDISGGSTVRAYYSYGTNRFGPITIWTNGGGANSSISFSNILQTMDSLDPSAAVYAGTGGSLELLTQDGGHVIQVASRSYNGNSSCSFPALLDVNDNTAAVGRSLVIPNISNNTGYRSKIMLVNTTSSSAVVEVKIIGSNGSQVGSTINRTMAGYEMLPLVNELRVNTYNNAFIRIDVISGSGRIMASGQTSNNVTNDPAAHIAVQAGTGFANSPASRLLFPEVNWVGANNGGMWVTEMQIIDISGGSTVRAYYSYGANRFGPITIWTNSSGVANSSISFSNILQTMDSLDPSAAVYSGTGGSLELLTQDGGHVIQVASRSYNGNSSCSFAALLDVNDNTAAVGRSLVIPNISNNTAYRSKIMLVNTTSNSAVVEVKIIGSNGSQVGSTINRTMAGYEMLPLVNELRVNTYDNATIRMDVISGGGRIMASGQTSNNVTNDPAAHIAVQAQ